MREATPVKASIIT